MRTTSAILAAVLIVPLAAWEQSRTDEQPSAKSTRSVRQAVQEGAIMEAVRLASESPDTLNSTVQTLIDTVDYLVGERRIADAQAILDKTLTFLQSYSKATGRPGVPRDPLRGRQLRLEGIKLTDAGKFTDAVGPLKEALDISRKTKDQKLEAGIHNNLGVALQSQGKLEEAKSEFEAAVRIAEGQKDVFRVASSTFNLGRVQLQQKQYDPALESFKRAEVLFKSVSKADLEALAVMMQGITLSRSDVTGAEAIKSFERACALFEQAGDKGNAGWTFVLMGNHLAQGGKFLEAAGYGERAIPYLTTAGDQTRLQQCYIFLAGMYEKGGKKDQAEKYRTLAGGKANN